MRRLGGWRRYWRGPVMATGSRRRRRPALALLGITAIAAGTVAAAASPASASSHREAPGIAGTPRLDTTDVYAFLSPDKAGTVTLMANWLPFSEPAGGPNFYTFDDDACVRHRRRHQRRRQAGRRLSLGVPDHGARTGTFLYNTGPVHLAHATPTSTSCQTYDLSEVPQRPLVAPSRTNPSRHRRTSARRRCPTTRSCASRPSYRDGDQKVFAGQADDPFFLDLRVFDLLYGGNLSEVGNDTLAGYNVNTVAIQVPVERAGRREERHRRLVADLREGRRRASTARSPGWATRWSTRSSSRSKDKDRFNASKPQGRRPVPQATSPSPGCRRWSRRCTSIKAPAEPRNDLVQVFLTGVPGLNQPKHVDALGDAAAQPDAVRGPEGRAGSASSVGTTTASPTAGGSPTTCSTPRCRSSRASSSASPNDLGDGVDANDVAFGSSFPYVALPNSGSASVNSAGWPRGQRRRAGQPARRAARQASPVPATVHPSGSGDHGARSTAPRRASPPPAGRSAACR